MLELYGKTYAANDREAVESLFTAGGTVNGTYKRTKAGIYLSDLTGNERVFIRRDGLGPVTVHRWQGRRRYLNAMTSADEQWIGYPESYMAAFEGAKDLALSQFPPPAVCA